MFLKTKNPQVKDPFYRRIPRKALTRVFTRPLITASWGALKERVKAPQLTEPNRNGPLSRLALTLGLVAILALGLIFDIPAPAAILIALPALVAEAFFLKNLLKDAWVMRTVQVAHRQNAPPSDQIYSQRTPETPETLKPKGKIEPLEPIEQLGTIEPLKPIEPLEPKGPIEPPNLLDPPARRFLEDDKIRGLKPQPLELASAPNLQEPNRQSPSFHNLKPGAPQAQERSKAPQIASLWALALIPLALIFNAACAGTVYTPKDPEVTALPAKPLDPALALLGFGVQGVIHLKYAYAGTALNPDRFNRLSVLSQSAGLNRPWLGSAGEAVLALAKSLGYSVRVEPRAAHFEVTLRPEPQLSYYDHIQDLNVALIPQAGILIDPINKILTLKPWPLW
ncbi:MAG: glutamate-rich protein 5 [Deltaproteobacteria bacterium]|jgi:hypothetical protein|nr:glutamate-rich protein 5 [Deltaproteobacteria bacterium]